MCSAAFIVDRIGKGHDESAWLPLTAVHQGPRSLHLPRQWSSAGMNTVSRVLHPARCPLGEKRCTTTAHTRLQPHRTATFQLARVPLSLMLGSIRSLPRSLRTAPRSVTRSTMSVPSKRGAALCIGTHDGTFHCDEALGCFMLKRTKVPPSPPLDMCHPTPAGPTPCVVHPAQPVDRFIDHAGVLGGGGGAHARRDDSDGHGRGHRRGWRVRSRCAPRRHSKTPASSVRG